MEEIKVFKWIPPTRKYPTYKEINKIKKIKTLFKKII